MRYTEARLAKITEELLADLDKDTVPFTDNFDGSLQEPAGHAGAFAQLAADGRGRHCGRHGHQNSAA